MIGSLEKMLDDMENGVFDLTKDGECSKCGKCCSALLPLNKKEIKRIKDYVKKNDIKTVKHLPPTNDRFLIDLTCPFLDNSKELKCRIYPVRPYICRKFICNVPPSKAEHDKEEIHKSRIAVNMWEVFG